jgi:hypothetical protein
VTKWVGAALLLWAVITVFRRSRERLVAERTPHDPEIDRSTLEAAEREVKDLGTDVRGRPLEDAVGDDWGPGTPKPPYV